MTKIWSTVTPSGPKHDGGPPLHSFNASNVQKPSVTNKLATKYNTVPMLQQISRCASMVASPTVGDVMSLDKLVRQIMSQRVKLQYWTLTEPLRKLGFPDVSYRNNDDGSSQRGMTVFLAESRERSPRDGMTYGSLFDYECQKIKKTVSSTTVADLYSFMKCFGSCQFLRELWMGISGEVANLHMRTDAKNLVTAARTIHLPEKKRPST